MFSEPRSIHTKDKTENFELYLKRFACINLYIKKINGVLQRILNEQFSMMELF